MKIDRVDATGLRVSVPFHGFGIDRTVALNVCHVEVETDDGLIGYGFTAIVEGDIVAHIVNAVAGPLILGEDPMANERIWERLYWKMSPRGQTGYASHAMAAIDVALWDIKGKYLNQPVWRLLGGAIRDVRVPGFRQGTARRGRQDMAVERPPETQDGGRRRSTTKSRHDPPGR